MQITGRAEVRIVPSVKLRVTRAASGARQVIVGDWVRYERIDRSHLRAVPKRERLVEVYCDAAPGRGNRAGPPLIVVRRGSLAIASVPSSNSTLWCPCRSGGHRFSDQKLTALIAEANIANATTCRKIPVSAIAPNTG